MPSLPLKPCKKAGCPNLTSSGFCQQCKESGVATEGRPSARERGYNTEWERYRLRFLRSHPYCADPFNRHGIQLIIATVVDHTIPHRGNQKLFWEATNHQPLCKQCHDYKTVNFDGGLGRECLKKEWVGL